jgi:hypothetical protein
MKPKQKPAVHQPSFHGKPNTTASANKEPDFKGTKPVKGSQQPAAQSWKDPNTA